jgi:hypothetical protein
MILRQGFGEQDNVNPLNLVVTTCTTTFDIKTLYLNAYFVRVFRTISTIKSDFDPSQFHRLVIQNRANFFS